MKGIILHGGHGTRLRPLTHTGPKQLLPIANKPMSQYCVETMIRAGIDDIAFIIGGVGSNKVTEYYGDGKEFGAKFSYIEQDYPKGIAHAVSLCEDFIGDEKFVVFLGDNIIQREIVDYVRNFQGSDATATLLLCEVDNPSQFGVAEIKDNKIVKITEKPKVPPSNLAVTGIYFLTPYIFNVIKKLKPSWRNELEIADALQILLDEGREVTYDTITDFWKDTGTPSDIIEANRLVLEGMKDYFKGRKDEGASVEGKVSVGEGTIIKKGSSVTGPAIIGKNCTIGGSARICGNTSIGDNSCIDGCTVYNSIIMPNCVIEGNLKITNSIIGSNSKIFRKDNSDEKSLLLGEGTQIYL